MSKKKQTYSVGIRVRAWVDVDVKADSFAEAVDKAAKLNIEEILPPTGGYNDYEMVVVGAHDSSIELP